MNLYSSAAASRVAWVSSAEADETWEAKSLNSARTGNYHPST
jgi:hypothetical protein